MSIFKALIRTVTSPIEITARTVKGVLDFSDDSVDNPGTFVDVMTMGITRPIRKGSSAIKKTCEGISDEFDD